MQHQAMDILLALARECRYALHECNVLFRELKSFEAKGDTSSNDFTDCMKSYLLSQLKYVTLLNALNVAKETVGRIS